MERSPSELKWTKPAVSFTMPREAISFAGRDGFVMLPSSGAGRPTPWVWYAPVLPGIPDGMEEWMFRRFLAAGIAIAGVDVGESFGSPAGRELFSAFHEKLVRTRGFASKACLLARSRGALMLYNWAADHPQNVACIAGIYPVCDLRSYPGLAQACSAYGMDEAQLAASLPAHNPVDRLEPLAAAEVPLFHIHGNEDTVVPLEPNTGAVADRYRGLGGPMTLLVPPGQGHNYWPGFFECEELVQFIVRHARSTVSAS